MNRSTSLAPVGRRSQHERRRHAANARTALALLAALVGAASIHVIVRAQSGQSVGGAGQNINVITGSADQFTGDKFRQRQNESMLAVSSVNSAHMIVVYNDARTVDYPDDAIVGSQSPGQGFVAKVLDLFRAPWRRDRERKGAWEADGPAAMPNQAWIGMSFTDNGGKSWYTGLHPGNYGVQIPSDTDPMLPDAVELHNYVAANDPVIAATHNEFFVGGIAFNLTSPNGDGRGIGFVSRLTDRNNTETGQNIHFDGTKVLLRSTDFVTATSTSFFVDKPSIAAAPGAPNGKAYVYAAFVVFDTTDAQKLSSKVLFYRSADSGQSWAGPITISQPLTRNQAPWIVVDPNSPTTVYVGWRVFANPLYPNLTNAIVGRRSFDGGATFSPSVPYPVALLLKAFDQPQGNLLGSTLPSPRSAAYPSATIDGNGAIQVLVQEYVYPANYPTTGLRGLPLAPNALLTVGVPRITATTSYNQGVTWTLRKAIDLANGAGTQFMPTITAVGEPGPSCQGKTGPRSRVIAMFYDARPSGLGVNGGSYGIVSGGDKRFDVRIAQASACSANSLTGLAFSPSEQVSQYTRNSTLPFDIVTKAGYGGITATATNNAYPMSCTGNCAFSGDYNHVTSRTGYVKVGDTWKLTTAVGVDPNALPAPVVQAVWADTRDALLPTTGLRPVTVAGESLIDQLEWNNYAAPGTGFAPCKNPGSRDQNIYTAEYTPGGLFASAPITFKSSSDIPRAYPLYVENRTGQSRSYLLTIDPLANAAFDYTDFDPNVPQVLNNPPLATDHNGFGEPYARQQAVVIGAISSVTGSVVVGPRVSTPVRITIEETNVQSPAVPARTIVTLTPSPEGGTPSETYQPVIAPTPIVTKPLAGHVPLTVKPTDTIPSPSPFSPNPFSPNPFSPNPFSPNPFSPNPFSPNPFSPNPFSPNAFPDGAIVQDVTDISYVVTNEGDQTAAFNALANVQAPGIHVYQLLLNRAVPTPNLIFDKNGNCQAVDTSQAVPISTIGNPFSPNPFSPNPFSPNPFSPNPFSPNPFSPNAFPSEFSNATFYVKPSQPGSGTLQANAALAKYVADPSPDVMVATIRDFLIAGTAVTPQNVSFTVQAQAPAHDATSYVGTPPISGTHVPDRLVFTQQPTSTLAGQPISPAVNVAIVDAFGDVVTSSTLPVTIGLGTNPTGGTLSGTVTTNASNGVATFSDLRIGKAGAGYTLLASSGRLRSATSAPFSILAPDLVVSSGGVPSTSSVTPGGSVQLTAWTIKNQGSAGANAPTGTFRNGFYLSTDSVITSADTLLATNNNTNGVLPAGGSFVWGGPTLTIPANTAPGLYYIGILVDDQNVVTESNEGNNYVSTPITVVTGPQTFVVINTNDSGPGSLRQALLDSNANASFTDTILFAISGAAPHSITPLSGLPAINDPVIIDAAPAGQCSGVPPTVEIDGVSAAGGPHGLFVAAPGTIIRGLAITRFTTAESAGIFVASSGFGTTIECSYLGLAPDGTTAKGNYDGIHVGYAVNTIGGTSSAVRNVISGNIRNGILIQGPTSADGSVIRNVVQGNFIGTDASGTLNRGNGGNGVHIVNGGGNTVGGSAAARNVISGNLGEGIRIDGAFATSNLIQNNYIGTTADGFAALGNSASGVYNRRAPGNSVIGNLVSGNIGFAGVAICGNPVFCGGGDFGTQGNNASGNVVQGNLIGTNAAGSGPLGNNQRGVSIDGATNTLVGGTAAGTANTIAYNGFNGGGPGMLPGVVVFNPGSTGNQIRGNSIHDNYALGIDLGGDGVTLNDVGDTDVGPNNLQNFPAITSATFVNGTTTVVGTLNSAFGVTFTIDIFSNASCDPSGYGQGATFLGSTSVTTDVNGNASFSFAAAGPAIGNQITTTATDAGGNTSEFSACVPVTQAPALGSINLAPASETIVCCSFNETRAVSVTVLTSGPLTVSSMTLSGLTIPFGSGGASSALYGARIYTDSGTLFTSADTTSASNGPITIPISATLEPGVTYRVGFYVATTPPNLGSGNFLVPAGWGFPGGVYTHPPYMDPSGTFQIAAAWSSSPAGDAFPNSPNEGVPEITITVAPSQTAGFAYVANEGGGNVSAFSIDAATGALSPVAGSPFLAGADPFWATADPAGSFAYVANVLDNDVSAYSINGAGVLTPVSGSPFAAGTGPTSVTVDPTGRFAYTANAYSNNVSAYSISGTTGALTPVSGSPFSAGTHSYTVAVDPTGHFAYVSNQISNDVSAYSMDGTTGALTAVIGSPFAAGTSPYVMTVDPTGRFAYVANNGDNNISAYSINAMTGALTPVAGSPFVAGSNPRSVTVDPTGKFLYTANQNGVGVSAYSIDGTTGALTPVPGSPFAADAQPVSVTVDHTGHFVYVANASSNDISAYVVNRTTGALTAIAGSPFAAGTFPVSVVTR